MIALQTEKAGRVAIVHQSQILFAFLIQVFYLGERQDLDKII